MARFASPFFHGVNKHVYTMTVIWTKSVSYNYYVLFANTLPTMPHLANHRTERISVWCWVTIRTWTVLGWWFLIFFFLFVVCFWCKATKHPSDKLEALSLKTFSKKYISIDETKFSAILFLMGKKTFKLNTRHRLLNYQIERIAFNVFVN